MNTYMKGWMNELLRVTNGNSSVTTDWKQLGEKMEFQMRG
jgi:hypothetical protein